MLLVTIPGSQINHVGDFFFNLVDACLNQDTFSGTKLRTERDKVRQSEIERKGEMAGGREAGVGVGRGLKSKPDGQFQSFYIYILPIYESLLGSFGPLTLKIFLHFKVGLNILLQ